MTQIDHVLFATPDLDIGEQQLWRGYGLGSIPGGRHVSWGTANRIAPLGSQYLELVAAENAELARHSLLGRAVLAAADRDRLTPVGLCLRVDDLTELETRLGQPGEAGSRVQADGTEIRWTTVGLGQAFGPTRLPFFIAWENAAQHPSQATARHRIAPLEIFEVEVGGAESVLRHRLGGDVPGVRVVGGAPGVRSITVRLEDGSELHLP